MRALVVFARLFPLVVSLLRDRRRWLWRGAPMERSPEFHRRRAERLVANVVALGPVWVKLAQVFASRADVVPEPYLAALGTLVDRVPAVPVHEVRAEIEAAFGQPVSTLFERFDESPLASASLGQVHRARYRGEEIAVKVLRPGIEELVAQDVTAARRLLDLVEPRFPRNPHVRGLRPVLEEFAERIAEELDLRQEAAYSEEVRANFARERRVLIPAIVPGLVRRRVLASVYVEGCRIDRLAEWAQRGDVEPMSVVRTVMELYVQMMLIDGLFHADPHPGNLLVAPDGRVVLLDFGMVVRVPVELRRRLITTVYAGIRRDVNGLVDGFYALGLVDTEMASRATVHALIARLLDLAHDDLTGAEKAELVAAEVLRELNGWPIVLPREMVYFARTAALVEGLGTRYDRRFNPILFAGPIALRLRSRVMAALGESEATPAGEALGDLVAGLGGFLGEIASVVVRAGREIAALVSERVELAGATMRESAPPLPPRTLLSAGDD
jgi:predicted unusual protein kinase regulating ubiquinone biosynthesis (AarF/ABC1/UbiB family)